MRTASSISVIIPALNEEGNLRNTVDSVYQAMGKKFDTYEILIFNDGSTDATGKIAEDLAEKDKNVKVIHNPKTRGFGYNISEGIKRAKCEYVTLVPGDNEVPAESTQKMFQAVGQADIVTTYFSNVDADGTYPIETIPTLVMELNI